MEYIDIYDESNNPTGKIKEKTKAHKDGDFHRTAHIWIINDKHELLLQKRSATKKFHPNCWDISGAGHIRAGETVIGGAIRELEEYRRQGIGKRLVQELKNYCMSKGIEEIKVTASAKNVNAREFYKSNGFEDFEVTYKMKLEGN